MGILSNIFAKIFPGHQAANQNDTSSVEMSTAGPGGPTVASGTSPVTSTAGNAGGTTPSQPVDVEAMLNDMASKNPEKLNWRTSIVDLMKLLGLDSSLAHRKELAQELHYTGDTNDSASMNIWLHKQVMQKIAANGGKLPADLLQ